MRRLQRLSAAPRFHLAGVERLGADLLESYERDV